jgi:hypothetical protein
VFCDEEGLGNADPDCQVGPSSDVGSIAEKRESFSHKLSGVPPAIWVRGSVSRGSSVWFVNLSAFLRPFSAEVRNVSTHSSAFYLHSSLCLEGVVLH